MGLSTAPRMRGASLAAGVIVEGVMEEVEEEAKDTKMETEESAVVAGIGVKEEDIEEPLN